MCVCVCVVCGNESTSQGGLHIRYLSHVTLRDKWVETTWLLLWDTLQSLNKSSVWIFAGWWNPLLDDIQAAHPSFSVIHKHNEIYGAVHCFHQAKDLDAAVWHLTLNESTVKPHSQSWNNFCFGKSLAAFSLQEVWAGTRWYEHWQERFSNHSFKPLFTSKCKIHKSYEMM